MITLFEVNPSTADEIAAGTCSVERIQLKIDAVAMIKNIIPVVFAD